MIRHTLLLSGTCHGWSTIEWGIGEAARDIFEQGIFAKTVLEEKGARRE
jgi:hypothetical protein